MSVVTLAHDPQTQRRAAGRHPGGPTGDGRWRTARFRRRDLAIGRVEPGSGTALR